VNAKHPDPKIEFLRQAMSRRGFLGAMGAAGASAALAACGTGGGTSGQTQPSGGSGDNKTIVWANWTLYLDYDEESRTFPSLVAFEEESG